MAASASVFTWATSRPSKRPRNGSTSFAISIRAPGPVRLPARSCASARPRSKPRERLHNPLRRVPRQRRRSKLRSTFQLCRLPYPSRRRFRLPGRLPFSARSPPCPRLTHCLQRGLPPLLRRGRLFPHRSRRSSRFLQTRTSPQPRVQRVAVHDKQPPSSRRLNGLQHRRVQKCRSRPRACQRAPARSLPSRRVGPQRRRRSRLLTP